MLGSLIRAVLILVVIVAVVAAAGAFLFGYRLSDGGTLVREQPVGTSGRTDDRVATARERGAAIGERVGQAAAVAQDALSDGAITAKIKSKMALDDTIKARDIHVSTKDGVVTLTGTVASERERDRAVQLARETEGVKSVTDQLQIKQG